MNNSILTIRPYKRGSVWVFDEPSLDLFAEPFVGDVNESINRMLNRADLPASEPFTALFSSSPFPGIHMMLEKVGEECGGTWYHDVATDLRGWLCPALFKFFCTAPEIIYVRAEK